MKKIGLGISVAVIAVLVLLASGVVMAVPNEAADVAKERAPHLEKIEFVHWKEGFARPTCNSNGICEPELGENPSCADCKNGEEEEPAAACYAFSGKYGKTYLQWRELPVSYVINTMNPDGLSEDFVTTAISAGAEAWDDRTATGIFDNSYASSNGSETEYGVQNYVNAISFGNYTTEGVIAVARVWYNPATKTIVEFDIMFDTDWTWGDAAVDSTVMDLQNIAVHELGHGAGLADVYEAECSVVTMYAYSGYGETQKRDLEEPDITGIQELYGSL
jgi:hypothetical protein